MDGPSIGDLLAHVFDARARLRTMSLIHEQLYNSDQFSSVDLEDYVRQLLQQVAVSHGTDAQVEVEAQVDSMALPVDVALPCGMIINELVVNALQHAYIDHALSGTVRVSLSATDASLQIGIYDEGVGAAQDDMPEGFGLRLVRSLVTQLGGTLKYDIDESGTRVTVDVPRQPTTN